MRPMRIGTLTVTAGLVFASGVFAQDRQRTVIRQGPDNIGVWTSAIPAQDFGVVAGPIELGGQLVKDAPYSADVVSESTRTLPDGNRITRSSTVSVARDSRGRTRREQGLAMIGPLVGGDAPKHVVISDPEAGVSYMLDTTNRRATRLPMPTFTASGGPRTGVRGAPPPQGDTFVWFEAAGGAGVAGGAAAQGRGTFEVALPPMAVAAGAQAFAGHRPDVQTEELGSQSLDGVPVEGTRTTMTIDAGQIGNERPIEFVTERWFSPTLKVLVQSRDANPMFGDTSYRLTNIVLGEPPAWMFEVPSDFEVVDGLRPPQRGIRVERPRP